MLARWQEPADTKFGKRIVHNHASGARFYESDYLKAYEGEHNFQGAPNMRETRFHKGFQRKVDIGQDRERLQQEQRKEDIKIQKDRQRIEKFLAWRKDHTFNILTGEGAGRESDYRVSRKGVPLRDMADQLEKSRQQDAQLRLRSGECRFYNPSGPFTSPRRERNILSEGLQQEKKTTVIGVGHVSNRSLLPSLGVRDNFSFNHGL